MTKIYNASGQHLESASQQFSGTSILGISTTQVSALVQVLSDGSLIASNTFVSTETPDMNGQLFGVTLTTAQQGVKMGSIITPFAYSRVQSFSSVGTIGIDTSTAGLTLANDTIYAFPFLIGHMAVGVTKIKFGVSVADASGTGDIDVGFFLPSFPTSSAKADCPIAAKPQAVVTISNISATGLQTATIAQLAGGGLVWVCLRADNIGTTVTLSQPLATEPRDCVQFFGLTNPEVNTPIYGVYYNSQTSMPADLTGVAISGFITTPVGITVSEL